jgi:hypothetical protein
VREFVRLILSRSLQKYFLKNPAIVLIFINLAISDTYSAIASYYQNETFIVVRFRMWVYFSNSKLFKHPLFRLANVKKK